VLVQRLVDHGIDPRQFARDCVEHLRALFILQVAPDADLVPGTPERLAQLHEQSGRLGRMQLLRAVELLADALDAHAGGRILVVMHVPALVGRLSSLVALARLAPFPLAEPVMTDAIEVGRFTALMEAYGVLAVLAGHTHFHSETAVGGVRYIVGGTVGGLTPGWGIQHEYLTLQIVGRDIEAQRVRLGRPPPREPISFVSEVFRFYARLIEMLSAMGKPAMLDCAGDGWVSGDLLEVEDAGVVHALVFMELTAGYDARWVDAYPTDGDEPLGAAVAFCWPWGDTHRGPEIAGGDWLRR
jgi:hypothetical protein